MAKLICDVCGSTYSDTASVCPVCGTAKTERARTFSTSNESESAETGNSGSYTYVKGGRFSTANVRKRAEGKELTRSAPAAARKPKQERSYEAPEETEDVPSNRGLVIVVIILLLAIIAVCAYIGIRYIQLNPTETTDPSDTEPPVIGGYEIPCSGIAFPQTEMDCVSTDGTVQLQPSVQPSNTTENVIFTSSDEKIAAVSEDGVVTVLGTGQVTITAKCGECESKIVLNCTFVDPSAPTDPTDPPAVLELVRTDITIKEYGATYKLYTGSIDTALIQFSSSDEKVVTVDDKGTIKVVGKGTATVTAVYENQTVSCIVRCTEVQVPVTSGYKLNHTDETIEVGETFSIKLVNAETGEPVTGLEWKLSMEGYATIQTTATGVKVTGTNVTVGVKGVYYVRVLVEYEGVQYQCIVRVKG